MNPYMFIHVVGRTKAPNATDWKNNVGRFGGINRLICAVGGEGGYYLRGEKHTFKSNYLYLLPSYNDLPTWSSYESEQSRLDHRYVNFEIIPPIITNEVLELDPHSDPLIASAFSVFEKITDSIECRIHNISNDNLHYLKATVMYIIEKMISKYNIKMLDDNVLISALTEMHKNIASDISIREIAKKSFMSYDGFIRRFQRALNVTPYAYLKHLRIRTALMLRYEGATLEEAAEKCGYSDASTLSHAITNEGYSLKIR